MRCRLDDAERTILLAEERLHEHNIIDENLSAMLAKVKLHSDAELRRFKEEAEIFLCVFVSPSIASYLG